jgi:hypothetical protein
LWTQNIGICIISNHFLQANLFETFSLFYEWNWLSWWLFWCHSWSSRCINIVIGVCFFYFMDNLDYVCLTRNQWDIYALENHDLISIDVQYLIMHSMPPSTCTYIQICISKYDKIRKKLKFCMNKKINNFIMQKWNEFWVFLFIFTMMNLILG